MVKRFLIPILLMAMVGLLSGGAAIAQQPRLKVVSPKADSTASDEPVVYLQGMADPAGSLTVNGNAVPIYSTRVFAAALTLQPGANVFDVAHRMGADTLRKRLVVVYTPPAPPRPTAGFAIESIRVFPGKTIWLQPGDRLQLEVKATPGMEASFLHDIPLLEADPMETGVAGIYRGEYVIQRSDSLANSPIRIRLRDPKTGKTITADSKERVTVLNQSHALTAVTVGGRTPLYYGLGTDRLGGARMGQLDSLVRLEVTGRVDDMYRVRLSDQLQAYVPVEELRLQRGVNFRPYSLTGSWSVYADSVADWVSIGLNDRLPYTATVLEHPTRIVIDVYGAVSNSNWITQKDGLRAIRHVWYEQVSSDVFRVYIELTHRQLWGYDLRYRGRQLVIRIKPQPESLDLARLRVAVDAGHGGSNSGAAGMTGVLEKTLTLSMALRLQAALERAGANVIMTRDRDCSVSNAARLSRLREQDPDMLISIHCNASRNPMVQGTSTYYRHQAYRSLSQHILTEMRQLGLADFGNVGGFNFVLNSPTEFPSVLVEVAFLSNPADEERLLDPAFHVDVAERIVAGVRRFLEDVEHN